MPDDVVDICVQLVTLWQRWLEHLAQDTDDDDQQYLADFIDIVETTAAPPQDAEPRELRNALALVLELNEMMTRYPDERGQIVRDAHSAAMRHMADLLNKRGLDFRLPDIRLT